MVINGKDLIEISPIKNMVPHKIREHGVSYGLGEAGYDIRLKQNIRFYPPDTMRLVELIQDGQRTKTDEYYKELLQQAHLGYTEIDNDLGQQTTVIGRFLRASAIDKFDMPKRVVSIIHDKSTWAREGLSVFNTVAEPGWTGFLTLEFVFHGNERIDLPAGAGIAQAIFHKTTRTAQYEGKYQDQEDRPVPARG